MKISVETANERIDQFVTQVVIPAARRPATLVKIGFAKGLDLIKLSDEHLEKLKKATILDDDGMIDTDKLRKGMESALKLAGKIPVDDLGISLNEAETAKFLQILETGRLA